uniref:No apical meristem-associated C-terminal domain-containing protein n=1 Tax=Setaria viridis TaxID=4556 RepID=A0A4U6VIM8_SETVI|nr:hypothetical protein SEVIR_3G341141v2 [Setaria viridis]
MSSAPIRQVQDRHGRQKMHRVMAVGGPNAQWNGSVAGDDDDPLAEHYPGSDAPYASFEHIANGNNFLNGNGYFSNMMMDETNQGNFDDYSNTYADQQSQAIEEVPAALSTRPNYKRSKNFSDHEDEVLVSGWLNAVEACALYKSEDEHQKVFQFMRCWNKLRTQPKWLAKIDELAASKTSNKKQKISSNAGTSASLPSELGEGEVQGIQDNVLTRPIDEQKKYYMSLRAEIMSRLSMPSA